MENLDSILDGEQTDKTSDIEVQHIISLNKFIFLSIISLGLYEVWWMYKSWRFFQQKEKLDIYPVLRALFGIFFLHALIVKIMNGASSKGHIAKDYTPTFLFIGFVITNLLSRLPGNYWIVSVLSFVFLIPPFQALNYAKLHSEDVITVEQHSYNGRQIAVIIVGFIFWAFIIVSMSAEILGIDKI